MKSSGKNDVSIIVSITAAAALIYGVVIWRARVVAQRMEEDVSNIWIGDGTPMVSDVDSFLICFLYYYFICWQQSGVLNIVFVRGIAAECERWRIPRISIPHCHRKRTRGPLDLDDR